jgi:hypothetical protein
MGAGGVGVKPIRLVAPFLPLPVENHHHKELEGFDWVDAIRMLSRSAERSCGVPVEVITDVDADLPLPCLRYQTTHRRLMLWVLEVCVRYLESADFDRDTVVLDCDQLVYSDLRPFFAANADLGVLIRPTHQDKDTWKKVLNGVQFWSLRGKKRLAHFYREALSRAEQMGDELVKWGADTEALRQLLEPVSLGMHTRGGVRVHMIDCDRVLEALSQEQIEGLQRGVAPRQLRPVTDFRYLRKVWMRQTYEMTVPA